MSNVAFSFNSIDSNDTILLCSLFFCVLFIIRSMFFFLGLVETFNN